MDYFNKVCWVAIFENFVCDKAYFQLFPVFNWESMKFFDWGDMGILRRMS